MGDITCTIHKMVAFIVIMMFSVCILFVAMTSVAYIVGYVYDGIFGNSILRLGHFIGRKHPKIKNMPMIVKAWKKIQSKEVYLRYETPLFAYCFSYTAISLLLFILPDENGMSSIDVYKRQLPSP